MMIKINGSDWAEKVLSHPEQKQHAGSVPAEKELPSNPSGPGKNGLKHYISVSKPGQAAGEEEQQGN